MTKVKYSYSYPENIEMAKQLKHGDKVLIARVAKRSKEFINMVFAGKRRMKPGVKRVYDMVVRFNRELDAVMNEK